MNDTLKHTSCRLCGSQEYKFLLKDIETYIGEKYSLKQCLSCTFVTIYPLPGPETLSRYYTSEYWQTLRHKDFGIFYKFFSFRMQPVLRDIKKLHPYGKRLLDWGAGDCAWLNIVRRAGYEGWGIDQYKINPNDELVKNGDIESTEFPKEYFDIVTCFHVLEHLDDPISKFNVAITKLKPGGIMVVEVPNIDSLCFKLFRKRWQPLELPTHLNHFSSTTLRKIILGNGQAEIVKKQYFSLRASPAAIVLSLFPGMTPKSMRKDWNGCYPILLKIFYLFLQIIAYPFSILESGLGYGSIVRVYVKKLAK